jgi:hypothetical protein
MLSIEKVDTSNKSQVKRFVEIPYRLYRDNAQWTPPLYTDAYLPLNRKKHPFHEHSEVEFFLAVRDGKDVGRIAAIENRPFNEYHHTKQAQFYFFECEEDEEAAAALFETVFDWARARGLDAVVGPKGMSAFDGYGILIEGYEHRQMMTMTNYNYPYYRRFIEAMGFEKEVDFVSCYLPSDAFKLPERVERIAKRALQRGTLKIKRFKNKRELIKWAPKIGEAYNKSFVKNWEYYPLSPREIDFVVDNIMLVADYRLIKVITHEDDVVGFLFAFPDVTAAMQRARGRLFPFGLIDLLLEMKRTKIVSGNGIGILPEYHGIGGNAILYYAMANTFFNEFNFEFVEMTQVAETAVEMRRDLKNLGGVEYKNHRVYRKTLD